MLIADTRLFEFGGPCRSVDHRVLGLVWDTWVQGLGMLLRS